MALPSCGHLEWRHDLPIVLGLCKRLGLAPDELEEPMAEERIDASPKVRLLLVHGRYYGLSLSCFLNTKQKTEERKRWEEKSNAGH